MASKTYIPTLVRFLHRTCVYIVRYRITLIRFLPTGGEAALDAIVLACETFIDLVGDEM